MVEIRIAGVCERDLDLLFAEEASSSPAFRALLLSAVGVDVPDTHRLVSIKRSVTHSTGESDLEIEVELPGAKTVVLLLENKIDASLQDRQAERYAERAASYLAEGRCAIARTLVLAPQGYLVDDDDMGFDASLQYEAVLNWFASSGADAGRRSYKETLLRTAIDKVRKRQNIADAAIGAIWTRYAEIAAHDAPELKLPPAKARPSGSHFVYFRTSVIPKPIQLVHKFAYGHLDLQFPKWGPSVHRLRASLAKDAPLGFGVFRAAGSGVLRKSVPKIRPGDAPEETDAAVRASLTAAQQVLSWAQERIAVLEELAKGPA